jgi:two-component system cell cycle sensor histidine kinase PleC
VAQFILLYSLAGDVGGEVKEIPRVPGKVGSLQEISAILDEGRKSSVDTWFTICAILVSSLFSCVITAGFCITILFRRLNALHFNLAAISHDAKGPLTAARGNIENALSNKLENLPPSIRKGLTNALSSIESVGSLINDVHYVSKLEASGNVALHEPCNLSDLVDDIALSIRGKFNEKGIALATVLPDKPALALGDISLLERLLRNILENSLRYTERGGRVIVSLEHLGRFQRISVADSGCGIAKQDIPKIFDKEFRGRNVRAATEGSGIGLTVARQIAELHNSRLHVTSELGKGATVSWDVPVK